MTELYTYHKDSLPLQEVIQLPLAAGTLGLFYAPKQCQFGRWENGTVSDAQGHPFALEQVFEARLFHPTAEVRWLRDPYSNGLGRAVYLMDKEHQNQTAFTGKGWQTQTLGGLVPQDNQYMLWGEHWETDDSTAGWSALATTRIGKLPVPLPNLTKNQRVCLKTVEYVGFSCHADGRLTLAGEYGNQVVVEERWLTLEPFSPQ